jgi:putative membrane protein
MVADLGRKGIADRRVLEAVRSVARERFVEEALHGKAYSDSALPIGEKQTISQPWIVAKMSELVEPDGTGRVLEIGTGSGYQAAVLSYLFEQVYSVERIASLSSRARAVVRGLGIENVHFKIFDGSYGWSEFAPFRAIVVTAGSPDIPAPLLSQLEDGGRLVIPLADTSDPEVQTLVKADGEEPGYRGDVGMAVRGFLMGGADIIPGVSGGTVALILGIYRRLVGAISSFDLTLLDLVRRGEIRKAAEHVDLRFLVALGAGIVTGIVSLASLMHHLLTDPATRTLTLAGFFGLILASGVLVGRMVQRWAGGTVVLAVAGTVFAYGITGLQSLTVEPSAGYIFMSGAIAICAMILPGISGAYILLLLGMYIHVTGAIKGIPKGDLSSENLVTIAVFCAGCGLGLLAFSKVLKWLLSIYEAPTMAVLCGFMIGSLRKIWPFKRDLSPHEEELKLKRFANELPDALDGPVLAAIGIAALAVVTVFVVDRIARPRASRGL